MTRTWPVLPACGALRIGTNARPMIYSGSFLTIIPTCAGFCCRMIGRDTRCERIFRCEDMSLIAWSDGTYGTNETYGTSRTHMSHTSHWSHWSHWSHSIV